MVLNDPRPIRINSLCYKKGYGAMKLMKEFPAKKI